MLTFLHAILLGAPVQPNSQIQPASKPLDISGNPKAAALASACTYRNSWMATVTPASCTRLSDKGWTLRNHYQATTEYHDTPIGTISDVDNADVYTKDGDCLLAFQGADSELYGGLEAGYHSYQGQEGVTKITAELEGLLVEIAKEHGGSMAAAFENCGSLIVTGHSLGATQAAIFAWIANKNGDPRGIGKTVSEVYLAAPTTVSNEVQLTNEQTTDGCFAGAAYYTAVPSSVTDLPGYILDLNIVMGGFSGTPAGYESLWLSPNQNAQHIKIAWQMIDITTSSGSAFSTSTACGSYPDAFSDLLSNGELLNASISTWVAPPYYLHSMENSYVPAFSSTQRL